MELDSHGDSVTLRPVRTGAGLQREQGVWVFRRGGAPITTESVNHLLADLRAGPTRERNDVDE